MYDTFVTYPSIVLLLQLEAYINGYYINNRLCFIFSTIELCQYRFDYSVHEHEAQCSSILMTQHPY